MSDLSFATKIRPFTVAFSPKPHMSSERHLYASSLRALADCWRVKSLLSKPLERSRPSQRWPGRMPYRFGITWPLYLGFSVEGV
jgi:hypothetical protein